MFPTQPSSIDKNLLIEAFVIAYICHSPFTVDNGYVRYDFVKVIDMKQIKLMMMLGFILMASGCASKGSLSVGSGEMSVQKISGPTAGALREDYTKSSKVFRYAKAAIESKELGRERKALSDKSIVGAGMVAAQVIDGSGFSASLGMMFIGASIQDQQLYMLMTDEDSVFAPSERYKAEAFFGLFEDTGPDAMLDAMKSIIREVDGLCLERNNRGGFIFSYSERANGRVLGQCKGSQVGISMIRVIHEKHFGAKHEGKIFVSVRGKKEAIEPFRRAYANDKTKGTLSHQVIDGEPKMVALIGGDAVLFDPPKKK